MTPTLVVIFGPPAVGKMAVGAELSALTGFPLFHNHLSIEAVLPVFEFGTPAFGRLVGEFRERVFVEVAESDLPGLIFTYVWAFDDPSAPPTFQTDCPPISVKGIVPKVTPAASDITHFVGLETRRSQNSHCVNTVRPVHDAIGGRNHVA